MKGEVTVSLGDFDSDDILDAALEIITDHKKTTKPPTEGYHGRQWKTACDYIKKIAAALAHDIKTGAVDESALPPASTAATIKSIEELRALMKAAP